MTALKKDSSRLYQSILLLFPSDVALSEDFTRSFPSEDKQVKLKLRIMEKESCLGKSKTAEKQHFYPCFWLMCAIVGVRPTALEEENDSDSDLEEAMEGMKIDAKMEQSAS